MPNQEHIDRAIKNAITHAEQQNNSDQNNSDQNNSDPNNSTNQNVERLIQLWRAELEKNNEKLKVWRKKMGL